jgi:rod shape-determining protein MreC
MEYSPPPLFKQGASARAKVVFFALIAIALLVADSRLRTLAMIRQVVGTVLYPLQIVALMPRDAAYGIANYFTSLSSLEKENNSLKRQHTANAQMLQQAQQLVAENAQLRKLLGTSQVLPVSSLMSEIMYDTRDAFTRKIVLNRGAKHGVAAGQPVIDDVGVVGQVTRVFPFTSEVTLLTDKDQAIPVQVVRSGLRSIAYGRGQSGVLDLRFVAANADIQKGDLLVTSGIDGIYPPGLAVAKVVQVEHKSNDAFARIVCQPSAGIDRNRQVLILLADMNIAPRLAEEVNDKKDKGSRRRAADNAKDATKDAAADGVKPAPKDVREVARAGPADVAKDAPKDAAKSTVEAVKQDANTTLQSRVPAP